MKRKVFLSILCIAVLAFCGCANGGQAKREDRDNANSVSDTTNSNRTEEEKTPDVSNDVLSDNSETKMLTEEEAKEKALAHANLNSSQVTFVQCKLDYEDGRQVYDIEFYTGDNKEFDYEIDAYTGDVVSYDYDVENYVPQTTSGQAAGLTEEAAKKLALDRVPGATAGDLREFKMDRDDGRTEYEGKIIYGGMEYEFEIDAESGAFLDWESEPVGR